MSTFESSDFLPPDQVGSLYPTFALPGSPAYNAAVREHDMTRLESVANQPQSVYEDEAAAQQVAVDHFLAHAQAQFMPAIEAFTGEMHGRCTHAAKHEEQGRVLEEIPDLAEDPEAWREYVEHAARFETWEGGDERKYAVAGALGDSGLVLVGILVEQPERYYPRRTWAQITGNGTWVHAVHQQAGHASWGAVQNEQGLRTQTMVLKTPAPHIRDTAYKSHHHTDVTDYTFAVENGKGSFKQDGAAPITIGTLTFTPGIDATLYRGRLDDYVEAFGAQRIQ